MQERYLRWWTPHLSRDFEMLVFGEGRGLPLILFPTSFGRFYQNKDFKLTDAGAGDSGKVTIYCPDGIDTESFYNKSIHPAGSGQDAHGVRECAAARCVRSRAARMFSSSRDALRRESGRLSRAQYRLQTPRRGESRDQLVRRVRYQRFFDGYYDDNIYFNSPYDYLPNITDPWKFNHMNIILSTGEWDNTRHESMRMSGILNSKGIKHWLDDRKWSGHDWNYWRESLPYYLSMI